MKRLPAYRALTSLALLTLFALPAVTFGVPSAAAEAYTTSLRTFAPPFVVPGAIVPLDAAVGSAP